MIGPIHAELRRVVDGDTYVMLLDWHQTKFEKGAQTDHVRLRGWMAREKYAPAEYAPDGTMTRVSGRDAAALAATVLGTAKVITLMSYGRDSFGREIADLDVDGQDLGELLAAAKAVVPGDKMGLTPPD